MDLSGIINKWIDDWFIQNSNATIVAIHIEIYTKFSHDKSCDIIDNLLWQC